MQSTISGSDLGVFAFVPDVSVASDVVSVELPSAGAAKLCSFRHLTGFTC